MVLTHEILMQVLPEKQRRIYSILAGGGKYSAADLSVLTHYSDPRGHIRDLRIKALPFLMSGVITHIKTDGIKSIIS